MWESDEIIERTTFWNEEVDDIKSKRAFRAVLLFSFVGNLNEPEILLISYTIKEAALTISLEISDEFHMYHHNLILLHFQQECVLFKTQLLFW